MGTCNFGSWRGAHERCKESPNLPHVSRPGVDTICPQIRQVLKVTWLDSVHTSGARNSRTADFHYISSIYAQLELHALIESLIL